MALFQSDWGLRRKTPPRPQSAGAVHVARFNYVFNSALAFATDRLELGVLPAFARICDAIFIPNTAIAATCQIGFMSGDVGDPSNARTVGAELFAAGTGANATLVRMLLPSAFKLPAAQVDRSIGIQFAAADITASALKDVELLVFYEM